MARIEVNDLEQDEEISKEEMKSVLGGVGVDPDRIWSGSGKRFPDDVFFPDDVWTRGNQTIPTPQQ